MTLKFNYAAAKGLHTIPPRLWASVQLLTRLPWSCRVKSVANLSVTLLKAQNNPKLQSRFLRHFLFSQHYELYKTSLNWPPHTRMSWTYTVTAHYKYLSHPLIVSMNQPTIKLHC